MKAEHSEENARWFLTVVSREDPIKVLAIVGGDPFLTLREGKKLGILDKFGMHVGSVWNVEGMNITVTNQDIELKQLREHIQRLEGQVASFRQEAREFEEARQRREKAEE